MVAMVAAGAFSIGLGAGGQFAVGRRLGDAAIAALFAALAVVHLAVAAGA